MTGTKKFVGKAAVWLGGIADYVVNVAGPFGAAALRCNIGGLADPRVRGDGDARFEFENAAFLDLLGYASVHKCI